MVIWRPNWLKHLDSCITDRLNNRIQFVCLYAQACVDVLIYVGIAKITYGLFNRPLYAAIREIHFFVSVFSLTPSTYLKCLRSHVSQKFHSTEHFASHCSLFLFGKTCVGSKIFNWAHNYSFNFAVLGPALEYFSSEFILFCWHSYVVIKVRFLNGRDQVRSESLSSVLRYSNNTISSFH